MHAVAPERRGAASSTFFVAFDFGIASGGFLAGVLVKQLGYDAMFLCMIVPCLLSSGYYYAFGRRHASSFNPQNRRTGLNSDDDRPGLSARKSLPFVITISREYGSGGHRIGERLAQRLGVKFYDRELISLTAQQSGLGESTVQESEQTVSGRLMYDDPVQVIEIIGKQKNLFSLLSVICIFPIFSIFALFCPFSVIQYTFSTL